MNKKIIITLLALILITQLIPFTAAQCASFSDPKYRTICEKITDVGCKILQLIEGIAAGVATLMLVLAGYQWISSAALEDPRRRAEAKERIVHVFIGLIFIMLAVQLINFLFGSGFGFIINC